MEEPVVPPDGKSYSRGPLEEWIKTSEARTDVPRAQRGIARCPLNPGVPVKLSDLRPNHELRSMIAEHSAFLIKLAERAFAAG